MTGPRQIVVINPNSSVGVTADIERGLADLAFGGTVAIRCTTLAEGPPGIETDAHITEVVGPMVAHARRLEPDALAFVSACFSDPGLHELRRAFARPVLGVARSGLLLARALTSRIGVVSMGKASLSRHRALFRRLHIDDFVVDDRAVGMGVVALATAPEAFKRIGGVASGLVADGARALVLACTGMTRHRKRLEDLVGVPVIDPVRAAVGNGLALLG